MLLYFIVDHIYIYFKLFLIFYIKELEFNFMSKELGFFNSVAYHRLNVLQVVITQGKMIPFLGSEREMILKPFFNAKMIFKE